MKVYIGEFTEQDLKQGNDKKAIAEAQEKDENKRNGIKYIESKHDKKKNAMKVWLTDNFQLFLLFRISINLSYLIFFR